MVYYSTELGFMLGVLLLMLDSRIQLEGMIKSVKYDEVSKFLTESVLYMEILFALS